jgi:hypothetical protein
MTRVNFQTWDEERDLVWDRVHWEVLEQTGLLVKHAVDDHAKLDALLWGQNT